MPREFPDVETMSVDEEFTSARKPLDANDVADDNLDINPEDDAFDDVVGKEKKITADGGIIKKILTAGSGWETPETGDRVTVHYVGTLEDGTKFDSSRDRDEPFVFELGLGRVIKGWDQGVATMKKGEVALLTCQPDYAYGASGSPPKIPPNATLNFEVELLSWQSVKDISGDGGVIKTILQEGVDWSKPNGRDEVKVHYKAKVQGAESYFAESPEGGVEFTLADGHLCTGIATALKTMKKSEKVHLLLKPEYGFGEAGRTPDVPPHSNLEVELELESWKKVEDVTDDGGVVKKTLVPSKEYKRPKEGAKAKIRYTATLADGSVFESHPEGLELEFVVDEGHVVEGLDLGLMKMVKGERALLTISPEYGYGDAGKEGLLVPVPPNATLLYDVELIDFDNPKESWEMSDGEKVDAAKVFKEKGNAAFKAGRLKRAVTCYDKAASMVAVDKAFAEDLLAASKELKKSCWLNLAAVYLKQGNKKKVLENCNKVLEVDGSNIKALYRRASAYLSAQDFLEAELDIKRGLAVDAKNSDLLVLQKKLKAEQRISGKVEAALYSRMFSKPVTPATPAAAPAPASGEEPAAQASDPSTTGMEEDAKEEAAPAVTGEPAAEAAAPEVVMRDAAAPVAEEAPSTSGREQ